MHIPRRTSARCRSIINATQARANHAHGAAFAKSERRLTAAQVATYLDGLKHVAFGTVNMTRRAARRRRSTVISCAAASRSAPAEESARWRNLERNPACSAAHYVGSIVAVVVNGEVEELARDHPDHDEVHEVWAAHYGSSPYSWGDTVVIFRVQNPCRCGPSAAERARRSPQ